MIKIDFKDKTYQLPTKFEEIKLSQYLDLTDIDIVVSGATPMTDIERLTKTLSILSGLSIEDINQIQKDQVIMLFNSMNYIFKIKEHKLVDQIKLDGKWFGMNKNLNDISFEEYANLENFSELKDSKKNLHILMALLYRPQKFKHKQSKLSNFINKYIYTKEEYEIEDYDKNTILDRAELFKDNMTVDVVLGALFFFIILRTVYMKKTKSFTQKKMKTEIMKKMTEMGIQFHAIGDGMK